MSYPFVAAAAQYGTRKGPVKAFVVHIAEGGGTVGFLSRPNARNVSVHYVIERTGRIVQMVRESDATGSINPNDLRTTDDPTTFGATVRKAVMGEWDRDPNSATITVEVEGFAADGPNPAQQAALKALVADVRSRFPSMGLLGHRDFQEYKACPGKLISWAELGGHGTGDAMRDIDFTLAPALVDIPEGTAILNPDGSARLTSKNARAGVYSPGTTVSAGGTTLRLINWTSADPVPDLLLAAYGSKVTNVRPVTTDCTQAIADAKAAQHELTRAAAVKAVEAI